MFPVASVLSSKTTGCARSISLGVPCDSRKFESSLLHRINGLVFVAKTGSFHFTGQSKTGTCNVTTVEFGFQSVEVYVILTTFG